MPISSGGEGIAWRIRCDVRKSANENPIRKGEDVDLDTEMRQWSQTVYGVAHSLQIAKSIKMGNLTTLVESLSEAEGWTKSDLGFDSAVPEKKFVEGSIAFDGSDHEEIFVALSQRVVKMLFVNLMVLADECLAQLMSEAGVDPPNYLTSKAEWVKSRLGTKHVWAANGLLEMCAIRNAIVHNGGMLNSSSIHILESAGIKFVAPNHQVELSFGDLFRYRRALRTVLGEIQKLALL